jgi:hypothetical protein
LISCGDGVCRNGECLLPVCDPGTSFCSGSELRTCSADGTSSTLVRTCEGGCSGGACITDPCATDSSVGCEYYGLDLRNLLDADVAASSLSITAQGLPASVSVYDGTTLVSSFSLTATGTQVVVMPQGSIAGSAILPAWRVVSNTPVVVVQRNPDTLTDYSVDYSLLLAVGSLGTEYVVPGWPAVDTELGSDIAIVATAPGTTRVTVRPTTSTASGIGVASIAAGGSASFDVARGSTLYLAASTVGGDLSGTVVTATAPIAVFASTRCATVPASTGYCDHLEEQVPPVSRLSTQAWVPRFVARGTEPDVVRVYATAASTRLRTDPVVPGIDGVTISRGNYVEANITQPIVVTGTAPILVAHYMVGSTYPGADNGCDRGTVFGDTSACAIPPDPSCTSGSAIGDPAMSILPPVPSANVTRTFAVPSGYSANHISVATAVGATVTVNGTSQVATRIGGASSTVGSARFPLTGTTARVSSTAAWVAEIHGYACDVSFAHPSGF